MLRNTQKAYGLVAIAFHWLIAVLILGQWALGWRMEHIADQRRAFELIQWHKSFGLLILALAVLRLAWRFANPAPVLPPGMLGWERSGAKLSHAALYGLMLALPLSGWALVSVSLLEIPTFAFYLVLVPHLPFAKSDGAEALWTTVHIGLGWLLLAAVLLHVLAALRHHLFLRDGVVTRILSPGRPLTPD